MTALEPPFKAKDMSGLHQKISKGIYSRMEIILNSKAHQLLHRYRQAGSRSSVAMVAIATIGRLR